MIVTCFLFALATLSSALSSFTRSTRACSPPPRVFSIAEFTTFSPSPRNIEPQRIFFSIGDISCLSNTILNPSTPKACDDVDFDYLWDGGSLTVGETYTPCGNLTARVQVSGQISNIALYCYPVEPPYPFGYGTVCETPTNQITGQFTKNSTVTRRSCCS